MYWALLGTTALLIGGFATVLGALSSTIGEIFRTLPRDWVAEILTDAEEFEDQELPADRHALSMP